MKSLVEFINESLYSGSIPSIPGVSPKIVEYICFGIQRGYLTLSENGKHVKYGVSRENIYDLVDEREATREQIDKIIEQLERDKVFFKYETNDEYRKVGLKDPDDDPNI